MNTIIHMKQAMGDTEYIRDVQDAEYRKRLAARNEALAICTVIAKYFTAEKWDAWCDASPDDEIEFLEYVQTEAAYIITEIFDAEQVEQADETAKDAGWLGIDTHIAAAFMQPDPRTLEQITDDEYRAKRKQETQDFLARMNSPEMVERRGTVLTPHGWRTPR